MTVVLRCTARLLKEIGPVDVVGFSIDEERVKDSGLDVWYANLLKIGRKHHVLFTSATTLYSFLVPGVRKTELKEIEKLFISNLESNLRAEGFREDIIEGVLRRFDRIVLGKTLCRRVLGSMTDHARQYEFYMKEAGYPHEDILSLNRAINRTPMKMLDYDSSIDRLRCLLGDQRLMKQTIERIEYRRGMLEPYESPEVLPVKVWERENIPAEVKRAIKEEDLINIAGTYGDRSVGVPIEYDHLKLVLSEDVVEIEFYNRGITLFMTDDELFRRIHRVMCKLYKAEGFRMIEPRTFRGAHIRKRKLGRNDPCPCGSGKKYKKCCLVN